jgi:tRNA pseudouridine55 synthase
MKSAIAPTDGLTIVDKPAGLTSHDVVGRMRRLAHTRAVGHAGTLDPMATGVLVLAIGRATRLLPHLDLDAKTYRARIRLGLAMTTDDAEGEPLPATSPAIAAELTEAQVLTEVTRFVGAIMQVPSAVSAIKIDGQRAYKRVRAGESVELAARPVTVGRFDVIGWSRAGDFLDVDVEVDCSGGTYIRALARDLGAALGVGGHLTVLRRLRVGAFTDVQALTLEELATRADPVVITMVDALRAVMPLRALEADEVRQLSYGRFLDPSETPGTVAGVAPDGTVAALLRDHDRRARPVIVFVAR